MIVNYMYISMFLCILLLLVFIFFYISFKKIGAEFFKELERVEKEISRNQE